MFFTAFTSSFLVSRNFGLRRVKCFEGRERNIVFFLLEIALFTFLFLFICFIKTITDFRNRDRGRGYVGAVNKDDGDDKVMTLI